MLPVVHECCLRLWAKTFQQLWQARALSALSVESDKHQRSVLVSYLSSQPQFEY